MCVCVCVREREREREAVHVNNKYLIYRSISIYKLYICIAYTHTHTLSLSLSHTHTHSYIYIYMSQSINEKENPPSTGNLLPLSKRCWRATGWPIFLAFKIGNPGTQGGGAQRRHVDYYSAKIFHQTLFQGLSVAPIPSAE